MVIPDAGSEIRDLFQNGALSFRGSEIRDP